MKARLKSLQLSFYYKLKNTVKKLVKKRKIITIAELQKLKQEKECLQQALRSRPDSHRTDTLQMVPTKKNTQIVGANWLINFKSNSASEHGEDGILKEIFNILPPVNKWVVEFGAHDPEIISNTWRLINKEGWQACLIEADAGYYQKLKQYYQQSQAVHCVHTKVSYEGHERLDIILKNTPVPPDLDLMIIDIDGNDYHVWEAIDIYRAKVVMIEFNAAIPIDIAFVQPRNLMVNQGASLKAMTLLAARKGYKLICATSWNAIFVQEAYYSLFFQHEPALEAMYVHPAKHPIWMRAFQLYDGTLTIAPWDEMLWHSVNLQPSDYQVLPTSFRTFSRSLAQQDFILEKDGSRTSPQPETALYLQKLASMPGNVLAKFAENINSRYGEDGMLRKLVSLVKPEHRFIVDVGAWDGVQHSRSRSLLLDHSWSGLLLENDPAVLESLHKNMQSNPRVRVVDEPYSLTGEHSLEAILQRNNVPKDFEVLHLNIYGAEYQLWESLQTFTPRIVAVQFNPTIPNDIKFIQASDLHTHQGCSLRALVELAHYKNYELIGVTLETAFFVHRKYCYLLFEVLGWRAVDLDDMFSPMAMQLFQLYDGTLVLKGLDRLLWHALRIDQEKLQVVPTSLRKFHQFADADYKGFYYRV